MDPPPQDQAVEWPLLADLLADLVLLLVERALFGLGDVAAIGARHGALFLADRVILACSLCACDLVISPSRRSVLMRLL
ncbi:MAG TPA: hypothetical protein VKB20_01775 [Steroidobacteraceae bacterium]|nr:hypothetical protein [Steroidobacteraceae bacterium]